MLKMGWFGVVRGHTRSLKIAPFDRAHTSSWATATGDLYKKCREDRSSGSRDMLADRQTHRETDKPITITGWSNQFVSTYSRSRRCRYHIYIHLVDCLLSAILNVSSTSLFICHSVWRIVSWSCLQEQRERPLPFSLYDALFHALVQDKYEFVRFFLKRVKLKTFLDESQLKDLYTEVFKIAFIYNLRINIQYTSIIYSTVYKLIQKQNWSQLKNWKCTQNKI